MLEIDLDHKLNLNLQRDISGRRIAVLGEAKHGKTNITTFLIEELLKAGIPLTVIDIEGKYVGLKGKFNLSVVGCTEQADFLVWPEKAAVLAELSVSKGLSMILDLSELSLREQTDFLLAYLSSLWAVLAKKDISYEIIFDGIHKYIPQGVSVLSPLKELLKMITLQGYKRSLGSIISSKQATRISKTFFSQVELLFLHPIVSPTDLSVYKKIIPLPTQEVDALIGQMQPDQVVYIHNQQVELVQLQPPQNTARETVINQAFDAPVIGPPENIEIDNKFGILPFAATALTKSRSVSGDFNPRNHKDVQPFNDVSLERKNIELEAKVGRLQALLDDQALELATLKDLKEYLDDQEVRTQIAIKGGRTLYILE